MIKTIKTICTHLLHDRENTFFCFDPYITQLHESCLYQHLNNIKSTSKATWRPVARYTKSHTNRNQT